MAKWKLIDSKTGVELKTGDERMTFRNVPVTIESLQPPHKPGSTGKVYVRHSTGEVSVGYYPGIIGAEFSWTSERASPGFQRMNDRLGVDASERMRLDTIARQEDAMKDVRKKVVVVKDHVKDSNRTSHISDVVSGRRK